MHVEIVSVGREILRGRTSDTNAGYLAEFLSHRGALVHRITTVDDNDRSIASSVTEALGRGAHLVITTGGLGPASDDRTLGAVADALGVPLAIHPHAKAMVDASLRRLRSEHVVADLALTPAREKMCLVPVGSEPIANEVGTAPGIIARLPGGAAVVSLPGLPEEMRAVFDSALERLRDLIPRMHTARREVESPTADESALRRLLDQLVEEFPTVWVKSHVPGRGSDEPRILVTLETRAATSKQAEAAVEGALRRLLALGATRSR